MAMSAAEILLLAEPPADDTAIEKALADLDVKIWTWTDAMMSAQAALRSAYAQRPAPTFSASTYEDTATSFTAPAFQPASPVPGFAPPPPHAPPPPSAPSYSGGSDWRPTFVGQGQGEGGGNAWPTPNDNWSPAGQAAGTPATPAWSASGTPAWSPPPAAPQAPPPAAPSAWSGAGWAQPDPGATPASGAGRKPVKQAKSVKVAAAKPMGPTPEELASRAAEEEAALARLDEATARRVRLLRRLDPDTPIEKLIEKARQAHAQAGDTGAKDEKSSWWRRK